MLLTLSDAIKKLSHAQDELGGKLHEMHVQLQTNKDSMDEQAKTLLSMEAAIVNLSSESARLKKVALSAIAIALLAGCLTVYVTLAR